MKSLFPAGYFHQRENTKWGCCQGQFYCGKEGCKISASLYPERVCKHCMVKVFDAMCPEKKATLLMWTWPETPSLKIYSSFHQSKRSACGKGKYFITYSLAVDAKTPPHLILPSCPFSPVGSIHACALQKSFGDCVQCMVQLHEKICIKRCVDV